MRTEHERRVSLESHGSFPRPRSWHTKITPLEREPRGKGLRFSLSTTFLDPSFPEMRDSIWLPWFRVFLDSRREERLGQQKILAPTPTELGAVLILQLPHLINTLKYRG